MVVWLEEKAAEPVMITTRVFVTVVCCYITISTLLQTKDEFRFIIPYVEFSKQVKGGKPLILDTSVIIDGRIADLCDTRIIDSKLIVTRFVLQELQGIADSSDKLKRNRGRRGLDILKKLQTNNKIDIELLVGGVPEAGDKARVWMSALVLFAQARSAAASSPTTSTSTRSPSFRASTSSTSTRWPTPSRPWPCPARR